MTREEWWIRVVGLGVLAVEFCVLALWTVPFTFGLFMGTMFSLWGYLQYRWPTNWI
jgi:hypothetical protein